MDVSLPFPRRPMSRREALAAVGALLGVPAVSLFAGRAIAREEKGAANDADRFLDAVRRGDHDAVERLLAADPALARATDDAGRSAFVIAHLHGHAHVAERLLAAGVELDLVEAVLAEQWQRVEELAALDPAALHRAHPVGGTPLYAAALTGGLDFYRLRALGCDPDAAPDGGSGFTPARGALESVHAAWAAIAVADLCSNGADVNATQRGGDSVLHAAVRRRDASLVRLAVRKGANVAARDDRGRTARDLAADLGWDEGTALLDGHASLLRDDRSSRFALNANREPVERPDLSDVPQSVQNQVTGASHAKLERLKELVAPDPRLVFSVSTDDELAIEACAHVGTRSIIRFHLDHGAPLSLPTAVSLGDAEAVDFWFDRRPSLVHERGAHDFPLMWFAVNGGASIEMAERLVRRGVPVDQETMGTTALHLCAGRGLHDFARFLLDHGADPDAIGFKGSRSGESPLQIARATDDARMVALLEHAGATR